MSAWQDIRTAPVNREVEIRVGRRKFRAILVSDGSLNEDEQPCDQWQATTENHPRDWCDGCCWESNSNGLMSAPPEAWRELPGASA